jgi:CDP-4-dehydro-6-deoxyglucose reductase, E3
MSESSLNKSFRVALPDGAHFDALDDENLLAAAQRMHWLVRYGCRNGNCDACAATLLQGQVQQRDGSITSVPATNNAPAAKILLCLCKALTDLHISLPIDPRPGSMDQSQRSYACLHHQSVVDNKSILYFTLPAGRGPALDVNQIALIETEAGLLQAQIDHEKSQGRELVVSLVFASPLQTDTYYHVRYPLNTGSGPGSIDD